jgi:prepilin-type N-terminal cleavage/methylation domain-containing protein
MDGGPLQLERVTDRISKRLAGEAGWSLIELLVVMLILGLVLGAVIKLSVTGQQAAARDSERNITVQAGNTFADRITNELRQATTIHLSDTSCPAGSRTTNCIDFNLENRTIVNRDGAGNVTSVTRGSRRVRINCATGTCFRAVSTNVATPPSATDQQQFATKLQNASVTAPGGTVPPIFDYKAWNTTSPAGWKSMALSFSSSSITVAPPNWVNVTLVMARAGTRASAAGLKGNVDLQDAADFKNMNMDVSPCSPAAVAQSGC